LQVESRPVPGVYHSVLGEPEEYAQAARALGLDHLVPDERPVSAAPSTPPDERRREAAAAENRGGNNNNIRRGVRAADGTALGYGGNLFVIFFKKK
jgi:hypothetical protein